jgi:hypothetical protein
VPARLLTCLTLLGALSTACSPENKCGGALYFDAENVSCRPCPSDARFEAGSCVCQNDRVFENHRCVARDGAVDDVDAAVDPALVQPCQDYCAFINVCLAENDLAVSAVPTVIAGLHADAPVECASACAAAGGEGALATCVASGREDAACEGDDTPDGLRGALQLMADCAHAHMADPLLPVICAGLTQSPLVKDQIDFCD